ncbi:YqaJ viral recombinase family protein [Nitrosococcus wardiae]|uniref:Endonuclease n=1 Tax=Nitrosococcus wardiae TaxID=1814290 RepID=A0A4P7BXN5_9GAMM|nr:YqaJ viral recombinase family protein [Nitrosococcus wardiae]QBQ54928.1 endonuclease [Nitrosococcus wardiae]
MLTEQQLTEREKGLGGSDAPIVAGLSSWKQPLQLYYEKTGQVDFGDVEGEHIDFGNLLEEVIAQEAARRLEVKVRRVNRTRRHKEFPFMVANIDRDVAGQPWIMECKNAGFKSAEWGPEGSDEVPESYLIQCTHYLAVTGAELCKLAALFSGNHLRIYNIPRDPGLIDSLIAIEAAFWDCVKEGVPPDLDYEHPTTGQLLSKLYPGTTGEIIELPEPALHWHQVASQSAELEKQYKTAKEVAQNHLRALMGEASIALLPDGSGYTRKEIKRKGYTVAPASYMDFRYTKRPKGVEK